MRSLARSCRDPLRRLARYACLLAAWCASSCSGDQVRYATLASPPAAPDAAAAVLYLVGDGGEVNPDRDAVLEHLQADIRGVARGGSGPPVVVAFLGDNIYDEGASVENADEDLEKLAGQVLAIDSAPNVHAVFVPGNHDWANGAPLEDGRAAVARQREWLESMSTGRDVRFLPDDGCPGPATEDIGDVVHLVFVDTEWLLRLPEERCGTADAFYARLADDLRAHRERTVILLSHHPLESGGPHSGNVGLFERGPLVYFLAAKSGVLRQDLGSPAYTAMRRGFARAIAQSGAPPLIHAGGHDHTLQVIRMAGADEPRYQLVSGALSKTERVHGVAGTRYATNGFGYMRLDFVAGQVRVTVFRRDVSGGAVQAVFSCMLSRAAPAGECPEAPPADGA